MNEIESTKSFNERMFERIRSQIGELMTDEELKKVVDAAVQKAFFEPVTVMADSWGRVEKEDPIIVQEIRKLLTDKVREQVEQWVETHSLDIQIIISAQLGQGISKIIANYFDMRMQGPMMDLQQKLMEKGILS